MTTRARRHFNGHPLPRLKGHGDHTPPSYRPKRPRRPYVSAGYRFVSAPSHPNARQKGYIAEHRLVMSQHLGRPLQLGEIVHHVNGDGLDNRIENLELMAGVSDHMAEHRRSHSEIMKEFHRQNPDHARKMVEARRDKMTRQQMSEAGRKGAEARWGKR